MEIEMHGGYWQSINTHALIKVYQNLSCHFNFKNTIMYSRYTIKSLSSANAHL